MDSTHEEKPGAPDAGYHDDAQQSRKKPRRRQQSPRKVTPDYLERAALYHLERYASSTENLRRILMRKAWRSEKHHGTDNDEVTGWVEAIVTQFLETGLLDDVRYAEGRAASLQRRGDSQRSIRHKLLAKGLTSDVVDQALARVSAKELVDPDLVAAVRYVQRRRLGAFRGPDERADNRSRDIAAMARAGFSYDLAKCVIDSEDPENILCEAEEKARLIAE